MAKSTFRSLKGIVALVTGGASGLGRATTERLLEHGGKVAICDLPTSTGQVVARSFGDDCIFSAADVSSEDQVKNALNMIKQKFGRLDVVINCAGMSVAFKIYNFLRDKPQNLSDMQKMLQVNVNGTFNVNRLAVEMLAKNTPDVDGQKGVIINTSGISAYEGLIGQTTFAANCHAITSMTLPFARDLASEGIRCCTIATGFMKTELNSTLPEEVVNFIAEATPFPKRFGHPEEFAHLVQCIIENPMLNGEVIRLDGGTRFNL